MVISTDAGGPAATTRATTSGTSTCRPAESTTSRPAIADTDQMVASTEASSSRSDSAETALVRPPEHRGGLNDILLIGVAGS
jgi:hypothetical protein